MLSITETPSAVTLNGWLHLCSISKDNINAALSGNSALPVLAISGVGYVRKDSFFRHENSGASVFTMPAAYISNSSSEGTDNFGNYLDLTINLQVKVTDGGSSQSCSLRFRFYDGSGIFEGYILSHESGLVAFNATSVKLTRETPTTLASYFSTAAEYTSNVDVNESKTTFGSWLNTASILSGALVGPLYFSTDLVSFGHWYDVGNNFLVQPSYLYKLDINGDISQQFALTNPGFMFNVMDTGWAGATVYQKWVQRQNSDSVSSHAYLPPISSYAFYTATTNPYYSITAQGVADRLNYALANNYPFDVFQLDYGWFDKMGDYNLNSQFTNFLGTGLNVVQWIKARGLTYGRTIHVGCYFTPSAEDASSVFINNPSWFSGANGWQHYFNPSASGVVAYIQSICSKIIGYGFDYARYDFVYGPLSQMMQISKLFHDGLKALNSNFVIESHGSINIAFQDICRTQDTFGYAADAYNNNDWREQHARRYRMVAMTAPGKVVDTDGFGGNGYTYNLPSGTTAEYEQEIGLMLGYGRPIIYWFPNTWPMYSGDGESPAYAAAEPILLAGLNTFAAFPREVPQRAMTGDWSTLLSYSNGVTVAGTLAGSTVTGISTTTAGPTSTTTTGAPGSTTAGPDTTPDAFSFTPVTGAALSSVQAAASITISGINTSTSISISGAGASYQINNSGSWLSGTSTVNNGDTVIVRATAAGSYSTVSTATLTVGTVSVTFYVTTMAAPTTTTTTHAPTTTSAPYYQPSFGVQPYQIASSSNTITLAFVVDGSSNDGFEIYTVNPAFGPSQWPFGSAVPNQLQTVILTGYPPGFTWNNEWLRAVSPNSGLFCDSATFSGATATTTTGGPTTTTTTASPTLPSSPIVLRAVADTTTTTAGPTTTTTTIAPGSITTSTTAPPTTSTTASATTSTTSAPATTTQAPGSFPLLINVAGFTLPFAQTPGGALKMMIAGQLLEFGLGDTGAVQIMTPGGIKCLN